jgi:hypothetical protein
MGLEITGKSVLGRKYARGHSPDMGGCLKFPLLNWKQYSSTASKREMYVFQFFI